MSSEHNRFTLYLIPVPLSQEGLAHIPACVLNLLPRLTHLIAERARTARRWMKSLIPEMDVSSIRIIEWGKHGEQVDLSRFLDQVAESGGTLGLMSEAGCPAIADPGADVVALAHSKNWIVEPLSGPSSIFLALMASGMSGQHFGFCGYLPAKKPELKQRLKRLEQVSASDKSTQIFIETPYRNNQIIEACLETLHESTRFCVAKDINGEKEWIFSGSIKAWKTMHIPDLHKVPCIFLIAAYHG